MRHLIFTDTETGGLDPAFHEILTVALVEWRDGEIGDTAEWKVKADASRVSARALEVNGIDLKAHNEAALDPSRVAAEMLGWVRAHWPGAGGRVRLAGHNVAFDVGFLKALIGPTFSRAFHFRPVCTMSLLPYLWHAGIVPSDVGKLTEACAALGVPMPAQEAHTALGDALASARLYTAMLERVRC